MRERRQFLVEGPQAVREALGVTGCVDDLFVTGEAIARHDDIAVLAAAASVDVTLSSAEAVAALAGSVSPQGMVAVCRFIDVALSDALGSAARLVAVGAHVRDPGNAGSLIRCADAAGADAVVFAGSSVDPYNDKAVRSSAGSIFHLPLVVGTTVAAAVRELRGRGFEILAADSTGSQSLDESLDAGTLAGRVAWIFGNEAWGIPPDEVALADHAGRRTDLRQSREPQRVDRSRRVPLHHGTGPTSRRHSVSRAKPVRTAKGRAGCPARPSDR